MLSCSILPPRVAEIGIGLTSFGLLFTSLGIITFFDSGFLIMGNVSYTSWLPKPTYWLVKFGSRAQFFLLGLIWISTKQMF